MHKGDLDCADLAPIDSAASTGGIVALFCAEPDPEACHRSLISQRLIEQYRVTIEHLRPS